MMQLVPLASHEVPTPTPAPYQAGTTLMMATGEVITAYNNSLMLTLPTGGHHDLGIPLDHRDNPTFLPTHGGRHLLLTTLFAVWDIDFGRARATRLVDSSLPLKSAVPAPGGGIVTMLEAPYREMTLWQPASDGALRKRWEVKLPDGTDRLSACGDLPAVLVHGNSYAETAWLVAFDVHGPRPVALMPSNIAAVMWDTDTRRLLLLPLRTDGVPSDTWHHVEHAEQTTSAALREPPASGPDGFGAPRASFVVHGQLRATQAIDDDTYYIGASGTSIFNCIFRGFRFDARHGYTPRESEAWVMMLDDDRGQVRTTAHLPRHSRLSGAVRMADGEVVVADATARCLHTTRHLDAVTGGTWTEKRLPLAPQGLVVLPDQTLVTWGPSDVGESVLVRSGGVWDSLYALDFEIRCVHGTGLFNLWVAGADGQAQAWDGDRWHARPLPVGHNVTDLHVRTDGIVFAVTDRGAVLMHDTHGWHVVGQGPGPGAELFAVTWWRDAVWIGAGPLGLWRNRPGSWDFEVVKTSVHATGLVAGERLLITTGTRIVDTDDGVNYRAGGEDMLKARTQGLPLDHFAT